MKHFNVSNLKQKCVGSKTQHQVNGVGEPYRTFRNSLNYYASLFGTRGVIWHQGERDNDLNTTAPTYKLNLENVIQKTRDHFNTDLAWSISKVSSLNDTNLFDVEVTNGQDQARSGKNGAFGSYNSDNFSGSVYRQSEGNQYTHFNANGLNSLASNCESFMNLFFNKAPISANPIVPVTFTQSGGNKTVTLNFGAIGKSASDFNCFFWTTSDNYTAVSYPSYTCTSSDTFTKTFTSNGTWRCYMRDAKGNVYMTSSLTINTSSNARIAAPKIESSVYPNPTYVGFENTVKFDLEEVANVRVEIVNEAGQVLQLLTEGLHDKGKFEYPFTLKFKQLSGIEILYYRITINDISDTKRIVVD